MYLIVVIIGLHYALFHAMDQTLENIKNKKLIVFETILNHIIIFNHKTVCSLALVSKWSNKQIKNTDHRRKERLKTILSNHENRINLVWHIHGGAYAYMYYSANPKTLTMNYIYLSKRNQATHMTERWANDPHLMLKEHKIFFNRKGDACYYASGIMQILGHGTRREIIEYSLSIDNKSNAIRCVLGKTNEKKEFQTTSLALIAKNSFPDLTQAILNSSNQYELSTPWHKDRIKVFHWDGVIIPQRYSNSLLYLDSQDKPII